MPPSSSVFGFNSPSAGPDRPLEMLADCHERIERQCRTLERLSPHLAEHGADQPAQEAARSVMRYFDEAAANHHADEEQDLFQLLSQACQANHELANELHQLTHELTAQHRELEKLWQDVRPMLAGVTHGQFHAWKGAVAQTLVDAYRQHVALENATLLPTAAQHLDTEMQHQLGQAMARRRHLR